MQLSQNENYNQLLDHPVISVFLALKWQKCEKFLGVQLRITLMCVVTLTWYLFSMFSGDSLKGIQGQSSIFCSDPASTSSSIYTVGYGIFCCNFLVHVFRFVVVWYVFA